LLEQTLERARAVWTEYKNNPADSGTTLVHLAGLHWDFLMLDFTDDASELVHLLSSLIFACCDFIERNSPKNLCQLVDPLGFSWIKPLLLIPG
jgi:predicted MPP superfamily phosphohydrolase